MDNESVVGQAGGMVEVVRHDVAWGPVWAGVLTALALFALLDLLFLGFGVLMPSSSTGEPVAMSTGGAWLSAVLAWIAFFIGGWAAAFTGRIRGTTPGLAIGFMVWALGIVVIMALSALGLGFAFGVLGEVFAHFAQLSTSGMTAAGSEGLTSALGAASWAAFFFMLLSGIVAAIGGWVGAIGHHEKTPSTSTSVRPAYSHH